MFRVLSDEEAKKVTRWRAPEISGVAANTADSRQVVSALISSKDKSSRASGNTPNTAESANIEHTSAPALQAAVPAIRQASSSTVASESPASAAMLPTTNIALPNPSADMLQSSYDEGYALGRDEGQKHGADEGYARGFAEGNAALHQQSVAQLNSIIAQLGSVAGQTADAALEQEVLELTLQIARLVLQREISCEPEALMQLIRAGLQQLPSSGDTLRTVRMHPLDARLVRELLDESELLEIVDDSSLQQGDCTLECGASRVEAGVDNWLSSMADQLGLLPNVADTSVA